MSNALGAVKSPPLMSRRLEPAGEAPSRAPEAPAPSAAQRRAAAVNAPMPSAERARYAQAATAAAAGSTFDLWAKANEGRRVGETQEVFRANSAGGQAVRTVKTAMIEAGSDLKNDAASHLLKAVQGAFKALQPSMGPNDAVLIRAMVKNDRSEGPQAYRAVTLVVGRSGEVVSARALTPSAEPIEGIPLPAQDAKGERPRVAFEASVVPMTAAKSMALPAT